MSRFVYYEADDWVGLYVDGKLVDEGHSFTIPMFIDMLDIDCAVRTPNDEWITDRGGFPANIKDVKEAQ